MISAEPETMPEHVPFSQSVMILPEDKVETWLMKIQVMMIKSLYDLTKKCLADYPVPGIIRKPWIFGEYPSQSVLVVDQIMWTANCGDAISKIEDGQNPNAIKEFLEFSLKQMNHMVEIVRGDLNVL